MSERKAIPGHPFYEVNSVGQVFRVGSRRPLRPAIAKLSGYLHVALWEFGKGKKRYIHQLVALTFHGPRPSRRHHAAHRDGNKTNNTPLNVQWITKEENEADKIVHGRSNRGNRNGGAKLSESQVSEIRLRSQNLPRSASGCRIKKGALKSLATEYGVTAGCLRQIIRSVRWAHLQ